MSRTRPAVFVCAFALSSLLAAHAGGQELRWRSGEVLTRAAPSRAPSRSELIGRLRAGGERHVLVRFDVEPTGQSANAVIVESDPRGLKDDAVLRHIRRSRFRPQLVGGQVVRGENLALQFNFRYTSDALVEQQEGRSD